MDERGFGGSEAVGVRRASDRAWPESARLRPRPEPSLELKRTALLIALIVGAASEAIGLDPERAAAALFERTATGRSSVGVRR
ncbi:hypothetical protein [Paraburkholderia antibiotica]|uniref:Uncharacterized protein n=1 Tax=Paraburkholderia antibiotica TaxID=2728839 RepID=A0A7Y0FFQ0_9BURK|nr:hypothetical protein [Paraburkholderia antibiotica]NML34310.1 hypothetical protein [Paraburkholderia antibiotica]